jgi:biotin operon repressor
MGYQMTPSNNGRVSRLLTLLLLYRHGYYVGRYISLERVFEETCPGTSREMVRKVLRELRDEGAIVLQGRGRSAKWLRATGGEKP